MKKKINLELMKTAKALLLLFSFMFMGCENPTLTQEDIAKGLKSALEVGVDYALKTLGKEDGFLLDQAVKIGLPNDVANFVKQVASIPVVGSAVKGIEQELILTMNRAAEASIEEVVPTVLDAIRTITIQDASNILFSDDDYAATHYLHSKTYNRLCETCISVIQETLSKNIVGNISAQDTWGKLMTQYNTVAQIVQLEPIETDLSRYVTQKALDGVFLKICDEELKIRTDASARVNDILRKVFGELD
jgi:hypothetical protein